MGEKEWTGAADGGAERSTRVIRRLRDRLLRYILVPLLFLLFFSILATSTACPSSSDLAVKMVNFAQKTLLGLGFVAGWALSAPSLVPKQVGPQYQFATSNTTGGALRYVEDSGVCETT